MRKARVAHYVQESLAPSTHTAYASDIRRFIAWGGKVPTSPAVVAKYLASQAGKLKVSTLTRRLAAIAHAHTARGLKSPVASPLVRSTLRGIRRVHGSAQKQARPLTLAVVRKLAAPLQSFSKLRNARDRALLLLGFAGGLRRSEIAALLFSDLTFTKKG